MALAIIYYRNYNVIFDHLLEYKDIRLFSHCRNWTDIEEVPELIDNGWRYRYLESQGVDESEDGVMNDECKIDLDTNLFIWRTDNF